MGSSKIETMQGITSSHGDSQVLKGDTPYQTNLQIYTKML